MDYKEAIEILQTLYPFKCKMVDGRLQGGFRDYNCDTGKAITYAISAMQELQMYKAGKLVLIPDAVYGKQCEELDEYKKLGTLKEVRKAVEKQNAEKPKAYRLESHGVYDGLLYCCPNCGCSIIKQDNRGFLSGPMAKHCLNCGQKLDWMEVEE